MNRIAVFGMGYVGSVTAACLSRDGFAVIGVDLDHDKVAAINSGISPVLEPGLDELILRQHQAGRLMATTNAETAVRQTNMALVAVGTPSAADGSVNAEAVCRVVASIGRALRHPRRDYTVVIRSTLLPGILEEQLLPILEQELGRPTGDDVHLCYHPEFLRETSAISDYDHPPFILAGAGDRAVAEQVFALYPRAKAERLATDTRTAALVKYSCNAFHALKIAFANEIGTLARTLGADGHEVMQILCQDHQLNISPAYLKPGFAFGGSCLPKDVRALRRYAQRQALRVELIDAILASNEAHIDRGLELIRESGCRRIGLVGLSFKADTDDLRESPQVILAEALLGRGYDLKIYDPGVRPTHLIGKNLAYVDRHLPHLASLLLEQPAQLYAHAELLVLATNVANQLAWKVDFQGQTLDLRRDLAIADSSALRSRQDLFTPPRGVAGQASPAQA